MISRSPKEMGELLEVYRQGLLEILGMKLYGIYIYGASVFPDADPLQDIDCHVILRQVLTESEISAYHSLEKEIATQFPPLGEELDAYLILLDEAKDHKIPPHQLVPDIFDYSWALHCAHVRAGFVRILWGPEPTEIFPAPTWQEIDNALNHELQYVLDHPQYPAYGILNLCRILYSYTRADPAVSKRFSGHWGVEQFPSWAPLIRASMRFYKKEQSQGDMDFMEKQREDFYGFMVAEIKQARKGTMEK